MGGVPRDPAVRRSRRAPVDAQWELHNLTVDPEERTNLAGEADRAAVFSQLESVLERTRDEARRTPQHVNPAP